MKQRLACLAGYLLLAFVSFHANGQGISPVTQTFYKKAVGAVQVTNLSDTPKIVSCRSRGFDVNEHGSVIFRPLDPGLHVRISDDRTEIAPRGSRIVSFEATPHTAPGWFAITCRFEPTHLQSGFTVATELTSIVMIENKKFPLTDINLNARHANTGNKVFVEVQNRGNELVKVGPGEIIGHHKRERFSQLTVFPHHTRIVEVAWKEADQAQNVRIQVGKKRLETQIR